MNTSTPDHELTPGAVTPEQVTSSPVDELKEIFQEYANAPESDTKSTLLAVQKKLDAELANGSDSFDVPILDRNGNLIASFDNAEMVYEVVKLIIERATAGKIFVELSNITADDVTHPTVRVVLNKEKYYPRMRKEVPTIPIQRNKLRGNF